MNIDVKLLAVLALPLAYLFALAQLGLWLRQRAQRAHLHWAAANLCGAIGASLLVARDTLPLWITSTLANTFIVGSTLLIWVAMTRFDGREAPLRAFTISLLIFFCALQALWTFNSDLGLRVLLVSLTSGVANAGVAFELMRSQQTRQLKTRAFLAALFALHALFYLFRAATAVTLDANKDFLQATGIQNAAITISAVKMIAWNIAAILMVREQARSPG